MKTFTTAKGTVLPLLELQGKPYLEVAQRILWFREEHPLWTIDTEVKESGESVWFKATVKDESGRVLATGHRKVLSNKENEFEVAETGSIGRALAHASFGTAFALEIVEGARLADAPISHIHHQVSPAPSTTLKATPNLPPPSRSYTPEQVPVSLPAKLPADLGEYVIAVGKKYYGRTFKSLTAHELEGYMDYFINTEKKSGKSNSKQVVEFLMIAEKYLAETPELFSGPPAELPDVPL